MGNVHARLQVVCVVAALMGLASCQPAHDPTATSPAESPPPATAMTPPVQEAPAPGDAVPGARIEPGHEAATKACVAAVAKQTNVEESRLTVTEVLWAEAGVGVTILVPDAEAPWSCLSDDEGNVQGASYTGSEGTL